MSKQAIRGQVSTPFGRLTTGIMFGYTCMMVGLLTPAMMLLTFKMMEIDPNGYTSSYGLIAGVGAIFALAGNPLGGAISDRTNIGFGRRKTWIFLGPLLGAAALLFIGFATEIWQVLVGWCVAQLFFNFGMAAYTALIPDQVKVEKQGTISGLLGLALPLGVAIGTVLMMSIGTASTHTKSILISAIGVIGPIISLFIIRDGKVEIPHVERSGDKTSLVEKISKVYPSPRKFPEFSWAIASKFLIMMGYFSTLYMTVMLVNRLGFSEQQATNSIGTINLVGLAATSLTSIVGGLLADKFKKQKPFLYGSTVIIIVGLLMLTFTTNFSIILIASIIMGLGLGCFTAVDLALVSRILPNKEDAAKDFGLMNVANALPQSIVPALAPLLLAIGSWPFFFLFLTGCTVLGMLSLKPLPEVGQSKEEVVPLPIEVPRQLS